MSDRPDLDTLLEPVRRIARRAGEAVSEIYATAATEVTYKQDRSPLTAADLASQGVILPALRELTPEIPILSEESAAQPWETRRSWRRFWLVDPLDGTKEFLKRNGEFTVNIALVEEGRAVLGVVHAPVLGRDYLGAAGRGAWREEDGERTTLRAAGTGEPELAVVASRSHAGGLLAAFLAKLPAHRLVSLGSSLKLCLVAEGAADFYPRLGPTMEWDTAAAHAVVSAAGGRVVDLDGEELTYGKQDLHNPHFLVLGERPVDWRAALAAAGAS
jgi:3'(2'), 5'-bisphosphate nucleotidase